MDLNKYGTKLQDRLFKDAYRKLRKILRGLDIPLDFTKPLTENEYEIEQAFKPAYDFVRAYLETVALTAVNFSRLQLKEINNKVSVKNTDIEITVNWNKVDESVLNFLNRGDSFSNPYFDSVTQAIAFGNRNRLTEEYIAYVSGEKTLQDAYNFLRGGLSDDYRANLIVRGEMTQVWAIAQQESYRTSGTIRNAWNTRNDGPKVCPICAPLNGIETIIGQPFAGTRYTRPAAHGGCRCWLSPVPMTDEEIEEFISKGDTDKVKIKDKRKKSPAKEKTVAVQTPTVNQTPKPQTLEEFKKAFDKLDQSKWDRINSLHEQEIKEQTKLKRLNKSNFSALAERDKAKRNGEDPKVIKAHDDKIKDLENKIKEQSNLLVKIAKDKNDVDSVILKEQRALLYTDRKSDHEIKVESFTNRLPMKEVKEGLEEFNNLIPKELMIGKKISVDSSFNDIFNYQTMGSSRSWYNPNDNTIYYRDTVPTRVVIHEMVHWLENANKSINEKALKFLDRRTVGESEVKLKTLFPNHGYGDNETTKVDKFEQPYMGKEYVYSNGKRSTEILTMGIEGIWANPRDFIYKDPDYFEFIMKDILGRIK